MPKVPFELSRLEATREAPSSMAQGISPNAFQATNVAMEKAGGALADLGDKAVYLGALYERKQEMARDEVQLNNVKAQIYRDRNALNDKLQYTTDATGNQVPRTDFNNFVPETEKFNADTMTRYQGMVTNPQVWQKLQPFVALHQQDNLNAARSHARKLEHASWQNDWLASSDVYQDRMINAGNGEEAQKIGQEFTDTTTSLIRSGVITPEQGRAAIRNVAVKGDLGRAKNKVDEAPDEWLKSPVDPKDYPFLTDNEFRSLNRYAVQQSRENRIIAKQEQQERQNEAFGGILKTYVDKAKNGQNFTYDDLDKFAFDKSGQLQISPQQYDHLRLQIQSRQDHFETTERREPRMDADAWVKYGDLIDKIHSGDAKYADVAAMTGTFPTGVISGLMHEIKSTEKSDANNYGKTEKKAVFDYLNNFKKTLAPSTLAELKSDVSDMIAGDEYEPKQWMEQTQKMLQDKWRSSGGIQAMINERLNPGSGGKVQTIGPEKSPAQPSKQERKTIGGKSYIKKDGKWFEES